MTGWEVRHGDTLLALRELGAGTVDAVVTDPPYSSGGAFRSDRARPTGDKYLKGSQLPDFYGDNRSERGLLAWASLWLAECWRVTVDGGAVAVWTDWRSLPTITDAVQCGGYSWRGIGVWRKPQGRSRPTAGGLWNDTEFIVWGSKGRRSGACLPGVWEAASPRDKLHQTEKPQAALRDLVRFAPEGGLVLDPFAGSGSTGVAALMAGRRFIGIELSGEYVDISRRRLAAVAVSGADVARSAPALFDVEGDA